MKLTRLRSLSDRVQRLAVRAIVREEPKNTMKQLSSLIGIAALLFITGCASTDALISDSTKRAPTTSVEVFKEEQMPSRKFKEIAELSYLGPREDELRAQKKFMAQAKSLGGNALIFTVSNGSLKGGGTLFQTVAYVFKGKVIVYE